MPTTTSAPPITESVTDQRRERAKLYHVIMLNDDEHTYEYVIEMLQKIFGFPHAQAMAHTMEADTTGSSILMTCGLEEAERKRDQIHAYGPDWRLPHSKGSVAALVEPAAG
jgi:ATP-dependent Clp protease adaptor protein ClpS